MIRILPCIFLFSLLSTAAQSQCPDCRMGAHFPDSSKMKQVGQTSDLTDGTHAQFEANNSHKATSSGPATGALNLFYTDFNACGLNYVTGSDFVATRYSPPGSGFPATVNIAGMPTGPCVTIVKAYVCFGASYTEASAPTASVTITNPGGGNGTYSGAAAGTAGSVCWGETGTAGYTIDVTPTATTNGNYTINITGFTNAGSEIDGVTLLIIYSSPAAWTGSIILYDGCLSNSTGASMSYTGTGFNTCAAAGTASAFGCMGDMQNNVAATHTDQYNGVTATFNNNFWNCDIIPTTLTAGQTSCVFNGYTSNSGDCWLWSLAGLYWQNTGCTACTAGVITLTPSQVNPSCGNNNGSASVTATGGSPGYTYTWSNGATTSNITGLGVGSYTVKVKDAGCDSATVTITLTSATGPNIVSSQTNVSCNGGSNGSASVTVTGGSSPYTYSWSSGITSTTSTASNLAAGSYTVTVTDATGCSNTNVITITAPTAITAVPSSTAAACGGANGSANVSLAGGTAPYTYSWSNGATTSSISSLKPGTYCVTYTDANGCTNNLCVVIGNTSADTATITATTNVLCNGSKTGSATVTGTGGTSPYTYSWNTAPVQTTATATNLAAGSYIVTLTDASGCIDTATAVITQPPLLVPTAPAAQTICIGQSASLTVTAVGGTPAYNYTWAPATALSATTGATVTASPVTTTTYTITTTDANGCAGVPVTVTITVNPALKATASPAQSICTGGSATISANATGGDGTYTYAWAPAGGLSCTNCQSTTASPATTTTYTVTITDACGTPPVTATVLVTVNPSPAVLFKADTLAGCSPLCVNFTDMSTIASGSNTSWAWTFGDAGTSNSQNPNHCYNNAGVYNVGLTVTSNNGCVSTLNMPNMITVYSHPVAAFTASPQPASMLNPTVQFTDQSTDAYGINNWLWTFRDPADGISTLQNPSYTYADTGTYCAELVVINKMGCMDSVNNCEVIQPYFTIYIPNAFSPNSDGNNDVFQVKGNYICVFDMYIFDRWGNQLYHTTDINKGWNGAVNNGSDIIQEDTYIYVINIIDCVQHSKHSYIGRVSIVK